MHFTFTFGHERVELYLYSPYGPYGLYRASVPVQGYTFTYGVNLDRQHPASYKMGTWSLLGVKWSGRGVDHPPPSSVEVKERVELHLYSPSGPLWPVLG